MRSSARLRAVLLERRAFGYSSLMFRDYRLFTVLLVVAMTPACVFFGLRAVDVVGGYGASASRTFRMAGRDVAASTTNLARALRSTGFGLVQTARYNPSALPRALSYSGTFYVNRARAQRVLLERRVASARRRVEVARRRIDRLVAPVRPFRIASRTAYRSAFRYR